jgi:hypothetical protein
MSLLKGFNNDKKGAAHFAVRRQSFFMGTPPTSGSVLDVNLVTRHMFGSGRRIKLRTNGSGS